MPTFEDLKADLDRIGPEIQKKYDALSGRLDEQQATLTIMKAKGERPETPPEIARRIDEIGKALEGNEAASAEIKKELAGLVETSQASLAAAVERLGELEKAAQRGGLGFGGGDAAKTIGQQVLDMVEANRGVFEGRQKIKSGPALTFKSFEGQAAFSGANLPEVMKALSTGATTNFIPVMQLPGFIPMTRRRLRMRDLLPIVPTTFNTIRYLRQTGFTTSATSSVTSITRSSGVVTVTQNGHGYRTFDLVKIAGANQTEYNGNWRIKVVDANTYTFKILTTPVTPATGTLVARRMNNYGAAAFVAEGAQKPQADLFFEEKDAKVRTIAHYTKATRQVMDDMPGLRVKIDGELIYGLLRREDDALLYGTGSGDQITGIMNELDTQTYAWSQGQLKDTKADALRRASTLIELADYEPTGAVIHPTVWEEIELEKGTDDHYIWVKDMGGVGTAERIWRVPLVVTPAINYSQFLTGAFAFAARLYDREEANVRFAEQNEDDFVKNMVTILAEERLGVTWERPEAFVVGAYDAAPT